MKNKMPTHLWVNKVGEKFFSAFESRAVARQEAKLYRQARLETVGPHKYILEKKPS